ncbi:poly-gamma-glutamate hydrolase family protein [Mesorhizobium abyssinicae]|uniref:poly-gamma-glutamate hydrolase family protein n=1 Tax=Mesorhizobium abyssinicae TaxID=1209958 RepID=UPI0033989C54
MNLDEYEKTYLPTYDEFARTVRFILENALRADKNLPRPQSVQCRAKDVESLRRRLAGANKLDTQTLEVDRRDLAGARLIFYTNNDVDRFLASSLIRDNFEIEEDSTKIHHPIPENEEARYRAVHYTIRLREDRTRLPEYVKFAGLRCEIQVQTILNHAWSETSHDILYKDKLGNGYGGEAMKAIASRFARIMDKYLIPAGFEIQKAQQEYERLLQGKSLFDQDIATLLDSAQNNNERYEILSGLKDYAIPNYDDLPVAYAGLKAPLLRTVQAARATDAVPIETTYGEMEGFDAAAVTSLVLEIVERLRYADVVGTLQLLIEIYRDESAEDIRQAILNAVKRLAEYRIDAYNQVGPMLQMALVDHLAGMSSAELDSIRAVALTVWTEAVQSDITGAKWKADSVELSTGAVPASHQLMLVRDKAMKGLFAAYERSTDDTQKRRVLDALDAATRVPSQGQYSNDLLAITLKDATRIVEFVTTLSSSESYELLQHLEHQFLYDYRRARPLADEAGDRFNCRSQAAALIAAILKFRDTINADERFLQYKVLVGFESVFPEHWADEEFDYEKADEFRKREAEGYIEAIDDENENEWFGLLARCAETKSTDLATFPVFGSFLSNLAQRKPEVADRFLARASDDLRRFLPRFLDGLSRSGCTDIYANASERELASGTMLSGIARHLRYSEVSNPNLARRLLKHAIDVVDSVAVSECLLFVLEHYGTERITDSDSFLRDALSFLSERKDVRWVSEAWFLRKSAKVYSEITPERRAQILENLGYVSKVEYQAEAILARLAESQPEAVWDYFGARLAKDLGNNDSEGPFEAVPFRFHGLEKPLSKDPALAIRKGLAWFAGDRRLFQFRGGRLIGSAFPHCPPEFAAALADLVTAGGDFEADFALAILRNYHGEISTHVALKEVVSRFSDDDRKMSEVRAVIDSTGVVSGELGFADAWRVRRDSLAEWLSDERPSVKAFAEKHIADLNLRIASEHRSAESEREMRSRNYEDEHDEDDSRAHDGDADATNVEGGPTASEATSSPTNPEGTQDKYRSYAALAAGEVEGVDYRRSFTEKPSSFLIAAPHGGTIEPGTSEIAAAVAAGDLSLYCFEGLISNRPHTDLHIKSHLFDEPECLRLAAVADLVVTMHGRRDGGDTQTVWIGGLDHQLRDSVAKGLRDAGFHTATTGHRLPGEEQTNICNRGRRGRGVQVEIPRTLRDSMTPGSQALATFATAIRAAIL